MLEETKLKIENKLAPFIQERSLELVEFQLKRRNRVVAVEILADSEEGNITIDECCEVNKFVSRMIEDDQLIPDEYVVEVSSPGLDRPLKDQRDFKKLIGQDVRFYLKTPLEGKKEYCGKVEDVTNENVKVVEKNKYLVIPFKEIQKAKQEI